MKYLIVLATATLSTVKVSTQSLLAKRERLAPKDSVFFTMLIFFSAALLFSPYLFSIAGAVWLYAIAYAVCNTVFQITYICALSRGNVSLAVMFVNFGMILPIAVSVLMYGDRPSVFRIVGICLVLCAFLLNLKQGKERQRGYFALVVIAMFANGAGLSVQKLFSYFGHGDKVLSFVFASYLLSSVLCAIVYFTMIARTGEKVRALDKRTLFASVGAGMSLALFLALNTYAAGIIEGSFHYPAHSGTAILLSTVSGIVFFGDKLTVRQWIAFAVGTVAIILMNF